MKFRQSLISAHHNYLIDRMLTPGFLLGKADAKDDFWLLADVLLPEESAPFLSGRFYDPEGRFLVHLRGDQWVENPGGCRLQGSGDGFQILYPSGEVLLAVRTEVFTNGYLTRIQGKLYDRSGLLRVEPSFDSARVLDEAWHPLAAALRASKNDSVFR